MGQRSKEPAAVTLTSRVPRSINYYFGHYALLTPYIQPFTIGIAIGSSPLAVLAYIGEKIHDWSDPTKVDPQDIVDTVALYYLSGSFATSVVIYNQVSIVPFPPCFHSVLP